MSARTPQRVVLSWQGANGQTYHLTLDVSEKETHTLPSIVTEHPVETGVNTTDHIRPQADQLTIQGIISDTPLPSLLPADFVDGAKPVNIQVKGRDVTVGNLIGRPIPIAGALLSDVQLPVRGDTATVVGFDPAFLRSHSAYLAFRRIRAEGVLLSVSTTLYQYDSMALKQLAVNRDAKSSNALMFTLDLQEVRIGTTTAVSVPSISVKKKDTGKTAPKAAAPPPAEEESIAHKLFN